MSEAVVSGSEIEGAKRRSLTSWRRRKDVRPDEILDAAYGQFVMRGFTATKMEDIARAAGVTSGTVYRYFTNKEELLRAVVHESFARAFSDGEDLLSRHSGNAHELLALVVRMWWRNLGETRFSGIPKLMIVESANFPELAQTYERELIARGEAIIARVIEYGIERGEFRRVNVNVAVKLIEAPIIMAILWKHSDSCGAAALDVDRFLDEVIRTLTHGLANKSPITEQAS